MFIEYIFRLSLLKILAIVSNSIVFFYFCQILAEIFQDLLTNKDDYLRALRALLREIVRSLRHDFNFTTFCLALMQLRTESKFTDMEPMFKVSSCYNILFKLNFSKKSQAILIAVGSAFRPG